MNVRREVKKKLLQIYTKDDKRPQNQKFNAYLDNILTEMVKHQEKLEEYGHFLQFIEARDNWINILDHRLGKSAVIFIDSKNKQLHCEFDNEIDCLHVGFCFAVPKVYDKLVEHGFRPPRGTKVLEVK